MRFKGSFIRFSGMLSVMVFMAQQMVSAAEGPCDIYEAAGTPCVGAYSTTRYLSSKYSGPIYQVRKTTDKTTKDITGNDPGAEQDAFLGSSGAGTISKLYDQSGKGNDLTVAKKGSYSGTAAQNDNEANAKGKSISINGKKAYAVYIDPVQGYRNNQENYAGYPAKAPLGNGVPTGNKPMGSYALEDGSRANVGNACCFNFGLASTDNAAGPRGGMNALFFGICTYWDKGTGSGPWFMVDIEGGVSAGTKSNGNLPSSKFDYAFGLTKSNSTNMTIRVADASAGANSSAKLVTAFNASPVANWNVPGGITLGIGGDNSNSSNGTFYEGCIVSGRPSDETDALILKNIVAARYGATDVAIYGTKQVSPVSPSIVRYNPFNASAVISYTMQDARRVTMNIFDQQGRRVAVIVDGVMPAGRHQAVWDATRVPAGVYVCRTDIDGLEGWSDRIIVGK
jgi:non-reducing end alpha-L-arabinofuranosidase